jgi:pyruvate ferredoxin oxidoreductase alpha subunit
VVDELRGQGEKVGLLEIRSFRPLPRAALRRALRAVGKVAVLDRADSPGGLPPLAAEVTAAIGRPVGSYVYGLGGRDLRPEEIRELLLEEAGAGSIRYVGLRGMPCRA